jgi:hypothetical protein
MDVEKQEFGISLLGFDILKFQVIVMNKTLIEIEIILRTNRSAFSN